MIRSNTAVFCTKTNRVIDLVTDGATQVPQRLIEGYGDALVILPLQEAHRRYEAGFKSSVTEIDEEKWMYALEVLPPCRWHNRRGGESFHVSELLAGNIANIYVRIGKRYFTFTDDVRLTHDERCQRVIDFIKAEPAP